MTDDDLRGLRRLDRHVDADPAFAEELYAALRTTDARPARPSGALLLAATLVVLLALVGGTFAIGSGVLRVPSASTPPPEGELDVTRLPWWQVESFEQDDHFRGAVFRIGYTDGTMTAAYEMGLEDLNSGPFVVSPPAAGHVAIADRHDGQARLRLVTIADGTEEVVNLGDDSAIVAVSLAPDGTGAYLALADPETLSDQGTWWLAWGAEGAVQVTQPANGEVAISDGRETFAWTPDGTRLFVQTCPLATGEEICRWQVIAHPSRTVTELAPESAGRMEGLSNEYLLARASECLTGPCLFVLVALDTGEATPLDLGVHHATLAESDEGTLLVTDSGGTAEAPVIRARLLPDGEERIVYDGGGFLIWFPERMGLAPPPGWIVVHEEHGIGRETTESPPRLVRLSDGAEVRVSHLGGPFIAATPPPAPPTAPPNETPPVEPTPMPPVVALGIGDMAGVVADGPLILRTAPGTGDDSQNLDTGMLHQGQRARVIEGPVDASGDTWYLLRVGELEGWVADGSPDGGPSLTRVSNGLIAHVRGQGSGLPQIFAVESDGSGETLLTEIGGARSEAEARIVPALSCAFGVYDMTWSPAGDALLFTVPTDGCEPEIHRLDATSDEHAFVTAGGSPDWSPEGARIAFAESPPYCPGGPEECPGGPWEIQLIGEGGGEQAPVTQSEDGFAASLPDWSPDGARIAYAAQRLFDASPSAPGIYVADVERNRQIRLTDGLSPAWSPDGTRIAFERYVNDGATMEVWIIRADGTGLERLAEGSAPRWSPDGAAIAFGVSPDGDIGTAEIHVMDADGSNRRKLADGFAVDWSPDGSMLAYSRFGHAGGEVYVIHADGTGEARISEGESPAWQPLWGSPLPVP